MEEQKRRAVDKIIDGLVFRVSELETDMHELKKAVADNTLITKEIKEDTQVLRDVFSTGRLLNRFAVWLIPVFVAIGAVYSFWIWIKSQVKP